MPFTLVKWLHYLWLFLNIWGILVNLLHCCEDFSEGLGNSTQNVSVLQPLYGSNVGIWGSPLVRTYDHGSVGNQPNFLALLSNDVGCLCSVWPFPKNWDNWVKIHTGLQSLCGLMRELFEFSHKAGSCMMVVCENFPTIPDFLHLVLHHVCVLYTKNVIVKYSYGIHFAWCQNNCCGKCLAWESITKWVLFSNIPYLLYMLHFW